MKTENNIFHALNFDLEKCIGCNKCVKVCPTYALRVRDGKVVFDGLRCIDCGRCIPVCPTEAIIPFYDKLENIKKFKYKIAILTSSFPGQFEDSIGYKKAKKVICDLGFDLVLEESMVIDLMKKFIKDYIRTHKEIRPIISSDCPTIVRLIQVRFPILLPNLLHIESPVSLLSMFFREKISKDKKIDPKDIGIFTIVPCISQVTSVHQPEGTYTAYQDGALALKDIYCHVMRFHKDIKSTENIEVYKNGLLWSLSGKQAEELESKDIKTLAVSGIENVIKILNKIENHQLEYFDYVVLSNCINGCVGGVLNAENPFVAASRIKRLTKKAKPKHFYDENFVKMYKEGKFSVKALKPRSIMKLDEDILIAIEKMKKIDELVKLLPGYDCGVCGSPNCKIFAEDVIEGKVSIEVCPFVKKNSEANNE